MQVRLKTSGEKVNIWFIRVLRLINETFGVSNLSFSFLNWICLKKKYPPLSSLFLWRNHGLLRWRHHGSTFYSVVCCTWQLLKVQLSKKKTTKKNRVHKIFFPHFKKEGITYMISDEMHKLWSFTNIHLL